MRRACIAMILLLAGCASSGSLQRVEVNQEFKLGFHETASLRSTHVTIQFSSLIQDSRCPKEVQCITAGKASIELEWNAKGDRTKIELSTDSGANEATYGKFKIKLIEITPYPTAGQKTDPPQYTAILMISAS